MVGIEKLSEDTGISKKKTLKSLKELERKGKIEILSKPCHYSMFKIVDYDRFQGKPKIKSDIGIESKIHQAISSGLSLKELDIDFTDKQREIIGRIGLKEINRLWAIPNEKGES